MVAGKPKALDAAFHALSHPTRRAMIAMLADGEEYTIGELAEPFDVSLAASSKHVIVLEKADLVRRRVVGRTHACRLNPEPLARIADWTQEYRTAWERNFAKLDALLKRPGARRRGPPTRQEES